MPIVVKPKKTENRHRWLTRTEAAKFLWATRKLNPRQRRRVQRFFIIGWYTGSRHKAITRVGYDMIDFESRIMLRRLPGVAETKKRTPPVKIGRRLLSHIARWRRLDGHDAKFPIAHGGKAASDIGLGWIAARALAGFSADVIPHTLRHSRATHLMRQAVDPWEAAQSLGMSLQVLQSTYGHHHPSWQKGAAEAR
jgi:integrase